MAVVETGRGADVEASARLHESFEGQRQAFLRDPYPSLDERRELLGALAGAVVGHRDAIREAMSADFAVHPELFTDLVEVLGVAGRAAYAMEQLEDWMAAEERYVDPQLYGTGKAAIRYQPKGVVGTIVPWNFPFDLSLGPLVEQLAAGNRVIIKPSEYTPACGEVMRELVQATFDRDRVDVVLGGLELAKEFPTLRWDHLLYTGNPGVGREIAKAAAENLVPVTLELGGKSPVVFAPDRVDAESVANVIGIKLVKNGQMCITADYCLVPRDQTERFVELAKEHMREQLPEYSRTPDCTGIITERHLERLMGLLEEAEKGGAEVVQLDEQGELDRDTRRMPVHLVVDPPEDLGVMREEIFGPILPVVPYDSLDDAIAQINAGERPLALYVYAEDEEVAEKVLRETVSGGACVNACATHGALPSLAFGGVGQSGSGRHHGVEGFHEFSNPRGVFVRGEGDLLDAFTPPYGPQAQAVVDAALQG
ncbi:MAG: aldehyde dehydrogenase family protein [Thermoleophilaceae bacterium]